MSRPLEQDYIGLTEACPMERSSDKLSPSPSSSSSESTNVALNLKETELRLGLPGSRSPERNPAGFGAGVSIFGKGLEEKPLMSFVSGSKRGFSDANIDGSCGNVKWVFSDVDLGKKGPVLFSPSNNGSAMKEGVVAASVTQSSNLPQYNMDHHVNGDHGCSAPPAKAQMVGWPPVGSFRRNTMASNPIKNGDESQGKALYVKVSMDGAPYLRKVDLKTFCNYMELSSALEKMFSCFTIGHCSSPGLPGRDGLSESHLKDLLHGSEYVLTYEDRDSDWMLVGDVPWEMFIDSCKRLRIMKGSEAIGLAPRAMEKCKNRN